MRSFRRRGRAEGRKGGKTSTLAESNKARVEQRWHGQVKQVKLGIERSASKERRASAPREQQATPARASGHDRPRPTSDGGRMRSARVLSYCRPAREERAKHAGAIGGT
eukprot:4822946-Pleurochrysis_carterae.AAC.2